jgi:hypothetical protein
MLLTIKDLNAHRLITVARIVARSFYDAFEVISGTKRYRRATLRR